MEPNITRLCQILEYQFKDLNLLEAALTHRSVTAANNERLEFLGDSIVNFTIAEVLFQKFPNKREGDLSRLRANLVKGDTLAELAQELDFGSFVRLGPGELKSGGRRRTSILADTVEAIIAAVYLDGGMDVCKKMVLSWYASRLTKTALSSNFKDPKTQLQEALQAKKYSLPEYKIVDIKGDAHDQTFYVNCKVDELPHITKGKGATRRRAEQIAAEKYLELLNENPKEVLVK